MQGLLEVRLEVPQITLMLTMPQVYLTSHFASYWTNKFCGGGGKEDLLHGTALTTLAQQALDIGMYSTSTLCREIDSFEVSLQGLEWFCFSFKRYLQLLDSNLHCLTFTFYRRATKCGAVCI